ncbi:unnamed protein product [Notodromas monacha]|uniref:Uncharacterized protein n=1 Tax=Notodromas monacha TaxID=399045 RepID=A0A7R9GHW7_9CRUS|nr:unnamed protein product [Notodromas monacha]CAG0921214.1 unnamed protein product [Notodromas monacha]
MRRIHIIDFSSADCNTYHFDKSRTARWFVLEHPPDKDGPVYRDASGRSLKPAEPTFAELNSRADSPTRSYLFGMVEKATAEASKEEKLGKLRALRAQHTLRQQTQG